MTRLRGKHGERTVAGVSLGYEDEYSVRFTGQDCSGIMILLDFMLPIFRLFDDLQHEEQDLLAGV